MIELQILIDYNDADIAERTSEISEDQLKILEPLLKAISEFKSYISTVDLPSGSVWNVRHDNNYPHDPWDEKITYRPDLGEKSPKELYPNISDEAFNLFENFCPETEYGFHSIVILKVRRIIVESEIKYVQ